MNELEAEFIAVAKEVLGEFGFSAVIRRTSVNTGYNPDTLTAGVSNASFPCLAAFFDPANSKLTGYENLIAQDGKKGKWFYLQTDGQFDTGDTVEYGTRRLKAVGVTKIGVTDTIIFYKVMAEEVA